MKKIIISFLALLCFLCVSCSENTPNEEKEKPTILNDISFEFGGKTIHLNSSMSAQEVYGVIYTLLDQKSEIEMMVTPNYINRAYQREDSTVRHKKYENAYSYGLGLYDEESSETFKTIYKSYSDLYSRTDDEFVKFFEVIKASSEEKNEEIKNTDTYLKFYGTQNTLLAGEEGYETGELERHYSETIYYDTNEYNQTEMKGSQVKYYNSWKDMMGNNYFTASDSKLISDRLEFHPSIFLLDKINSNLNEFVSYSFSFTDEHIILKYHADISFTILSSLMDLPQITEEVIEEIKSRKELGEYYSLEVHLNYKSISHEENKDYIFADFVSQEASRVYKSVGVYGNEYYDDSIVGKEYNLFEKTLMKRTFQGLDLNLSDIENLKNTFISSIPANNNSIL